MPKQYDDGLTAKQRYFQKKYEEAEWIECACGCGEKLKAVDKYARPAKYVNGHNTRINEDGTNNTKWEVQRRYRLKHPDKCRIAKNRHRRKVKIKAIALKGGRCVRCSLKHDGKNEAMFDFHHLDPEHKDGTLSSMLSNKSWKVVEAELEKCVLLCSNCHRMVHDLEAQASEGVFNVEASNQRAGVTAHSHLDG